MPYTATQARSEYAPRLRRAQVVELCGRFGLSVATARLLVDGEAAPIPRLVYEGATRGYYDLETVLQAITMKPITDLTL